jgi:hypothetical protein
VEEGLLQPPLFRDVCGHDEVRGPTVVGDGLTDNLHVEDLAGPRLMAPADVIFRLVNPRLKHLAKRGPILGRSDVVEAKAEKLVPRVPVAFHGSVVHRQKLECGVVEDVRGDRREVEERLVVGTRTGVLAGAGGRYAGECYLIFPVQGAATRRGLR